MLYTPQGTRSNSDIMAINIFLNLHISFYFSWIPSSKFFEIPLTITTPTRKSNVTGYDILSHHSRIISYPKLYLINVWLILEKKPK